jgi:Flp pilus assembly protein TadB
MADKEQKQQEVQDFLEGNGRYIVTGFAILIALGLAWTVIDTGIVLFVVLVAIGAMAWYVWGTKE